MLTKRTSTTAIRALQRHERRATTAVKMSMKITHRWNKADWNGVFAHHHTDDVIVDWKGQEPTHGVAEHIPAMNAYVDSAGGTPPQITSHPIKFGAGDWTCVIGEFADGSRMVTVAKWRDGAIAEEYIWAEPTAACPTGFRSLHARITKLDRWGVV